MKLRHSQQKIVMYNKRNDQIIDNKSLRRLAAKHTKLYPYFPLEFSKPLVALKNL